MVDTGMIIAITLVAALFAAVAQYLFKRGITTFKINAKEIFRAVTKGRILLGLAMYFVSLVIYLYALHSAPVVSFVYPIFSSSLVFVLVISKYVLKEKMGMHRIAGILFIIAGIAMISLTM